MKRLFQYGSKLLAAYILALPILIGLHQLHHESHSDQLHSHTETVIEASDCGICDLYQNQTAVVELVGFPEVRLFASPIEQISSQEAARLIHAYPSLRGPPIS